MYHHISSPTPSRQTSVDPDQVRLALPRKKMLRDPSELLYGPKLQEFLLAIQETVHLQTRTKPKHVVCLWLQVYPVE